MKQLILTFALVLPLVAGPASFSAGRSFSSGSFSAGRSFSSGSIGGRSYSSPSPSYSPGRSYSSGSIGRTTAPSTSAYTSGKSYTPGSIGRPSAPSTSGYSNSKSYTLGRPSATTNSYSYDSVPRPSVVPRVNHYYFGGGYHPYYPWYMHFNPYVGSAPYYGGPVSYGFSFTSLLLDLVVVVVVILIFIWIVRRLA